MIISIGIYSINRPEAGYGRGGCIYMYICICGVMQDLHHQQQGPLREIPWNDWALLRGLWHHQGEAEQGPSPWFREPLKGITGILRDPFKGIM